MYCERCGADLPEGASFCTNCGAQYTQRDALVPVGADASGLTPSSVLTRGIIAAAFALTPFVNFVGIILGAIALNRANSYLAVYGPGSKQVKIGHILSKVGIFAGIGMTIFWIVYIVAIVLFAVNY